jgi:hypothetical protein
MNGSYWRMGGTRSQLLFSLSASLYRDDVPEDGGKMPLRKSRHEVMQLQGTQARDPLFVHKVLVYNEHMR